MISPISAAGCFNSPGRCFLSWFSENRKVFGLSCGEQRVPAGGGTWPVGGSGGLWCPRAEVTPAPSSGSAGWGSHQGVPCRGVDVPGGWTEALPAPHPIPEDSGFSGVPWLLVWLCQLGWDMFLGSPSNGESALGRVCASLSASQIPSSD